MSSLSWKKDFPSNSAPVIGLASKSQPVYPWSANGPSLGHWHSPSPFPRHSHALSTTATGAGELFLFGGYAQGSPDNDLYVFSTRDFSTSLLRTSGETPSPRYAHGAALTSTLLLIWGGLMNVNNPGLDDSLYLLNFVSREWTRVKINGPGPGGRYFHTTTLVGSNLFIFGGRSRNRGFNDIWALNLNHLTSNTLWESYEPAPGDRKPPSRCAHVSVTTGDRIIVFGGVDFPYWYNDTWSFDILTRKWTELQCTGSIPSPRGGHAAVLVDDVMYVFGGKAMDGTTLGDLTAFNLSTQRWTTFQGIGPSPSGRLNHAMATDGTRVFVLGGALSTGVQVDEAKPIHVLDTKQLDYSKPDFNNVNPSENTTQLARKSSAGRLTQGQPQEPISSSSDAHAAHGFPSFQRVTAQELDLPVSPRITLERNSSPNDLPSHPPGVNDNPREIAEDDDDGEGSAGQHGKLVAPDVSPGKENGRLEHEHLVELEREVSAILAAQTVRDRRNEQLTDELAQNNALLKQSEANARRAGLELRELQAKLESRDHALEEVQSALQEATSRAAEANERSQRELADVRAELEARKSELAAVQLRLKDTESGWAKSKVEKDTSITKTAVNLANTDEDGVMRRLSERMRAMEAEIASLRGNEKSFEMMECRNEG